MPSGNAHWASGNPLGKNETRLQSVRDALADALADVDAMLALNAGQRAASAGVELENAIRRKVPAILKL